MEPYDDQLQRAGDALQALADGPGKAAAETLEAAFGDAGLRIEQALARAARSGELDFSNMARSVLADLARIAAEAALASAGIGQAGRSMTVNLSMQDASQAHAISGSGSELSKTIAQAVARGGRFL
ncbi:phage tail tape measure C-terminal domain-containing protein [Henriciella mobilis]|nr:phage tail tape measure C-terminal domain-containing protein [Henriciella mobilis]